MDPVPARAFASEPAAFRDGLGERRRIVDPTGSDTLEVLCLRDDLTAVPSFEFALRERVSRLGPFNHQHFGRVLSVDRVNDRGATTLAVVSACTPGARLADILAVAELQRLPLDISAALCLIRQLVPAVAALHEHAREICHGAIGPERIVVAPNGRLVIVEYVLGSALEQLRFSHERYWKDLRLPMPRSAGVPRFDHRADVLQMGLVALSLVLGRPIHDDEYPARIGEAVGSAWAISADGGFEPLPPGLRAWLTRALQLDVRTAFATSAEARAELEKLIGDSNAASGQAALAAFLTQYHACSDQIDGAPGAVDAPPRTTAEPRIAPAPPAAGPSTTQSPSVTPPMVKPVPPPVVARTTPQPFTSSLGSRETGPAPPSKPSATPSSGPPRAGGDASLPRPLSPLASVSPVAASVVPAPPRGAAPSESSVVDRPADQAVPADARHSESVSAPTITPPARSSSSIAVELHGADVEPEPSRLRVVLAAAAVLGVVVAGVFLARPLFTRPDTGSLSVTTNPPGAQVVVDGRSRGVTPIKLTLKTGSHQVQLRGAGEPRSLTVAIAPGADMSQYIELPQTAAATGQLHVRTEPAGARVTIDGTPRGTTPLTVRSLTPGDHAVLLENDLGSVKQTVTIEQGATASLMVPLTAPEGVPVSGWIAITAPASVDVYENKQLIGSSQSDRIMIGAGAHQIEVVNDALGYRVLRSVQVQPGKVSQVRIDFPKSTIDINAAPWAEVWIDGQRAGETPIGNFQVAIGSHEVLFRHPDLGEASRTVTVTLKSPARLSVDLTKK